MAISTSDKENQSIAEAAVVIAEPIPLTVTGVDQSGQMFRENAKIIGLDGRDCTFQSKFQPELGSWVLAEINYSGAGMKPCTLQGQVMAVRADGATVKLYQVDLELETSQNVKIASGQARPEKAQPMSVPAPQPAVKDTQKTDAAAPGVPARPEANVQTSPPVESNSVKEVAGMARDAAPQKPAPDPQPAEEAGRPDAISELNKQFEVLKNSLSQEMRQMVQLAVGSSIEQAARAAVEKQISLNFQATIQTLNSDLVHQLGSRLADNKEVRSSIESMAKKILTDQIELSREALISEQKDLESRASEALRSLEMAISVEENKVTAAREGVTALLDKTESQREEAARRLQEGVEQLNQALQSTVEKFNGHVTSQLNSWSSQFKAHLERMSTEKSAQVAHDLEKDVAQQLLGANETLEKLSAGLKLMQGTVRLQEEKLAELSRNAAATFEKEIKAVLLRLVGTV